MLLATPLSTSSILWGKWWGAFRTVPLLCILPCAVLASFSLRRGDVVSPVVLAINIVSMGAAITSLGLALATWIKRLGRAVTISVVVNVLLTAGWMFLVMGISSYRRGGEYVAMASPFFGPGNMTFHGAHGGDDLISTMVAGYAWSIVFSSVAVGFFFLTLATFDRCLGRNTESLGRPRRVHKMKFDPDLVFE